MAEAKENGWTIETLRVHLLTLIEGNDKRYNQEFDNQKQAVKDALAAQKEQTSAAFQSSEKAIVKAEASQTTYNQGHNDLSRKMEDQYKALVPTAEHRADINALKSEAANEKINNEKRMDRMAEDIKSLRESRSSSIGADDGKKDVWGYIIGAVGLIVGVLGIISFIISQLKK